MLISMAGCSIKENKYSLYFATGDGKSLSEEKIVVEEGLAPDSTAYAVAEKLLEGPFKSEHKRVIPENTAVLGLRIEDKTATVNLSQEFEKTKDAATRLLAIYSMVNTLCSIEGINKVQILVNGRKLDYTASDGEMGALSMNNVITADEIGRSLTVVLELYFANEDKTALISEKRMIDIKDNETAEKTAIGELIKGPLVRGERLLTEDVKILSIETKDKFCYVNLSKEFLSLPATDAKLCVYSIVNTLTKLPEISSVQLFVEGEKAEKLGDVILTEPFGFNEELLD